jgi:ribosome biogenesis GTPase
VQAGEVDAARVERWKKLRAEDAGHSALALDRRRKGKALAQRVKQAKRAKREG